MSIVKYTNRKTGVVTLYESTSHYDPVTKQSRPIRKYLGRLDPVTGELIPSSGKRGRKSLIPRDDAGAPDDSEISAVRFGYEQELAARDKIIAEQAARIEALEQQKASVIGTLSSVLQTLSE